MGKKLIGAKFVSKQENHKMSFAYSFCSLVTDQKLYDSFVNSAKAAGFVSDCEFLSVDNTSTTQTDAYSGLNSMIERSQGNILILCHQDILFDFDNRIILEDRLKKLEQKDTKWGVCGVAGFPQNEKNQFVRITDKFGDNQMVGNFPTQVICLDECFLIIKRKSGVRLSANIFGYHLYGTDICLIAEILGYKAYVIDFHLRHLGNGLIGPSYHKAYNSFRQKWSYTLRDRYIRSTALPIFLTGRQEPYFLRNLRSWIARKIQKYQIR